MSTEKLELLVGQGINNPRNYIFLNKYEYESFAKFKLWFVEVRLESSFAGLSPLMHFLDSEPAQQIRRDDRAQN